jgi:hypothetical protein
MNLYGYMMKGLMLDASSGRWRCRPDHRQLPDHQLSSLPANFSLGSTPPPDSGSPASIRPLAAAPLASPLSFPVRQFAGQFQFNARGHRTGSGNPHSYPWRAAPSAKQGAPARGVSYIGPAHAGAWLLSAQSAAAPPLSRLETSHHSSIAPADDAKCQTRFALTLDRPPQR